MHWSSRTARKTLSSDLSAYEFAQFDGEAVEPVDSIADVLSEAWAEAERIRAQARLAGEADGRAAGMAAARTEAEPGLVALAQALYALAQERANLLATLEHDAAEVALRLAEHVLAGVLSIEPERVVDVARNALRHLSDRRHVTLVVNPADLGFVGEAVEAMQSELGGIEHLGVQADRRVGRGGVVARTDAGEIDAGIEAQLATAREIVSAVLSGERGS